MSAEERPPEPDQEQVQTNHLVTRLDQQLAEDRAHIDQRCTEFEAYFDKRFAAFERSRRIQFGILTTLIIAVLIKLFLG